MFKFRIKYGLIIFFGIFVLSCKNNKTTEKIVVAEVSNNKLFASDLSEIIPSGLEKGDSAVMADGYINKWVKQELLIQKANENLTPEQKDVTRELQEYRNSLIIYKYKNELMKQRMDTTVSEDEIEKYYNSNTDNFNLNKNIVKAIFIKVPNEVANPLLIKSLSANTSDEGLDELKEYCLQYAKGFDIFIDNWVDFETVKNNIPQKIDDDIRFLTRNNEIELKDSNYYYLVHIQEYKLKNDLAPLEFVKYNIKNLIINQRKIEFLKQIEKNIYTEGIRKNRFKVYNIEEHETK
ncbi:MAG: peptidyl-prolyl cis-trans isomerase [Draconibacterium sp.]|nr:peptidyl-prolyl cis-trans isomerase [Draconibacterium sp.]